MPGALGLRERVAGQLLTNVRLHIYTSLLYFYTGEARRPFSRLAAIFRVSKQERHSAIQQLVAAEAITSQDELRRKLVRRGFDVTQATLSRDIHELRLYKGPNGYAVPNGNGHVEEEEEQPSVDECWRVLDWR